MDIKSLFSKPIILFKIRFFLLSFIFFFINKLFMNMQNSKLAKDILNIPYTKIL